jgi:hypothetical protein
MNLQTYEITESNRPGYFKPKDGANKIRIVSEIMDYGSHFIKEEKKSHICLGAEDCRYCKAGEKPKLRYLTWIIDRADGQTKLYEFGHSVFKQLVGLAKTDDYMFETIPPYDITINKKGTDLNTEYTVVAARNNTDITAEEQTIIDELELIPSIINSKIEMERKGDEIAAVDAEPASIKTETAEGEISY